MANLPVTNAPLVQELGPGGGGTPFWGLNDQGASSSEAPLFSKDPWDTFWIGTRQLPGECTLIVGDIAQIEINSKKGKGVDGARLTVSGMKSGKFRVSCQIATAAQWAEIEDIVDVYWRNPGKTSNLDQVAVSVSHPGLAFVKAYSAVIAGVSPPQDGKVEGTKNVVFEFVWSIYLAQKKNVTKSAGDPAKEPRKAISRGAINETPKPPSSVASNMSTSGPLQSSVPQGAQ